MKIEIDRVNKTVRPVGRVKLKEFLEELKNLVPNWEEYTLDTNVNINWNPPTPEPLNPYPFKPEPYKPLSPWTDPYRLPPKPYSDPYRGEGLPPYSITFCPTE